MASFWHLIGFFLLIAQIGINAQGPPKVTGSYRATGEVVETLEDDTSVLVQVAFEESYDADTNNAAFSIWVTGKNALFIENFETKQTFKYTDGKDCAEVTAKEWLETKSPPSLLSYEDTNGTVRFSLKQLFSLDDKYLKEKNVPDVFRGVPARKWMYEIIGEEPDGQRRVLSIYAYWSDGGWNTTSNEEQAPLGFIVSKMDYKKGSAGVKLHEQFINVFGFVPNTIDHKLFEPIQGVICPNRKQTIKFPDVSKWKAVSLHSEVIFPKKQAISHSDIWFDPVNKLVRRDMVSVNNQRGGGYRDLEYESKIAIGKFGIAYTIRHFNKETMCTISAIQEVIYDSQDLIDIKVKLSDWNTGNLFGINRTTYTYIGKTSKRDIPCHLFQGVRKDWPEPSANIETLWEWCFSTNVTTKDDAVIFRNSEYGLVSAQMYIIKGDNPWYTGDQVIFHHFYDVNVMEPKTMGVVAFDAIEDCFDEESKRLLQFVIDWQVTDDDIYLIENATSDLNFLQLWKSALYIYSGIESSSLRITNVRAVIVGKEFVLKFTILDVIHPVRSGEKVMEQITASAAEMKLKENVEKKVIFVNYAPSRRVKPIKLGVVPQSVKLQDYDIFEPITAITSTPGQEGTTPSPGREETKNLHPPGTVAGVSIAMIIVGISIGGSAVFVKMNGLPSFLKYKGQ